MRTHEAMQIQACAAAPPRQAFKPPAATTPVLALLVGARHNGVVMDAPPPSDSPDSGALPAMAVRHDSAELALWVQAAAQGDARAFEAFYNATCACTGAVVRRIVGDNHFEDVLSDAYFQAWRHARRFEPQPGGALAWIVTIARSRALDRLRQERLRHGGAGGAPEFDAEAHSGADSVDPETLAASVEASSQLHRALARLSPHERWVLALAYFRDCSHSEIAAHTGLPLGTVKSLITRSQHKLRDTLNAPGSPAAAAAP